MIVHNALSSSRDCAADGIDHWTVVISATDHSITMMRMLAPRPTEMYCMYMTDSRLRDAIWLRFVVTIERTQLCDVTNILVINDFI